MRQMFFVFLGGGIGSVFRYLISSHTQKLWTYNSFPFGTLLANVLGCFLIGLFSGYFLKHDSDLKFLLMAGFCGGFTTFSTFSAESVSLWQDGQFLMLASYLLLSIIIGFLAVWLGLILTK